MDILYIIGKDCSKCNNLELKYSLRSIAKYGKNVNKVYVAGECPDWLSEEVVKLPFVQPYQTPKDNTEKAINILSTILYAVDNSDIADEFLISMDDHFYVRRVDFDNYPYYARLRGESKYTLPKVGTSEYMKFMTKTREFCIENELSYYFLCPHRNMHCSRTMVSETRTILERVISEKIPCESIAFMLNWWYSKHDMVITPVVDVKLQGGGDWWKTEPSHTEVFSTVDFEEGEGLHVLIDSLYPTKCKYEI